jgi:hypothetical protein
MLGPAFDRQYTLTDPAPQASARLGAQVALAPGAALASAPLYDGSLANPGLVQVAAASDPDADRWLDVDDNCSAAANADQLNTDRDFVELGPSKAFDDLTWPNSDTPGDACDPDDDNDGLTDTDELAGAACAGRATHPLLRDTDGDRTLDGSECALGSDPTDATSRPPGIVAPDADSDGLPDALDANDAATDSDGDGLRDGVEYRHYSSASSLTDSDGDSCTDGREAASVNADRDVNVLDLLIVASASAPGAYAASFDPNKDGMINVLDLLFVARQSGSC